MAPERPGSTVCAVMLVKDEADIIAYTLRHLKTQVDWVILADNGSTDGTREIAEALANETSEAWLDVIDDPDPGYWQSRKTSLLAQNALARGFDWVLPCDADEWWTAADGRTIRAYLGGITPDVYVIRGQLFHYFPTAIDPVDESDPYRRIRWRLPEAASLPKVCVRARDDLVVHVGNHGADYGSERVLRADGLRVDHFSWRTADQYVRKIRNGVTAYAAADIPEDTGAHWRMHGPADSDTFEPRVRRHFWTHFFRRDPQADRYVYDPVTERDNP